MATLTATTSAPPRAAADAALAGSAALWFFVALVGQWLFLYYIAAFYGTSALQGNFAAWSRNTNLIKGYIPGDTAGNLTFVITFWVFGCYLVPLAVLELYLRTKDNAGPHGRFAVAGGLVALTVLMGIGIFGSFMFLWRPFL